MPSYKTLRTCNKQGCQKITSNRFCGEHTVDYEREQKLREAEYDKSRGNSYARGYNSNWLKIRKMKLFREPLCERCQVNQIDEPAILVHHIDRNPRNNAPENLESLCVYCHELEHKGERFGKI